MAWDFQREEGSASTSKLSARNIHNSNQFDPSFQNSHYIGPHVTSFIFKKVVTERINPSNNIWSNSNISPTWIFLEIAGGFPLLFTTIWGDLGGLVVIKLLDSPRDTPGSPRAYSWGTPPQPFLEFLKSTILVGTVSEKKKNAGQETKTNKKTHNLFEKSICKQFFYEIVDVDQPCVLQLFLSKATLFANKAKSWPKEHFAIL